MIEHRNVVNFFTAMDEQLEFTPGVTHTGHVAGRHQHLVRHLRARAVLDADAWLHRRRAGRRGPAVDRDGGAGACCADQGDGLQPLLLRRPTPADNSSDRYRLLLEGAKFADTHGFAAVWTPERHFHEFGGLYPNPALTSAAVAVVTEHVEIRAGSVVLPLHNPIGVAEDWAVVDNLSNGRVGLSFASGWHANDFALAPGQLRASPRADGRGHRDGTRPVARRVGAGPQRRRSRRSR